MDPPKSKTTIRISTNIGPASQYANSQMTAMELKGKTPQEKGEHYLQLSLQGLRELAALLQDTRLSGSEKAAYNKAYNTGMARYDALDQLRDQLLAQKKSFRKFLVNLFFRESEASRFHKMSYGHYSAIRRTSDKLHRRLLPVITASGSLEECNVSVSEESPRDVVDGNLLVEDLPPDENLRGFNVDVHTEEERNEALGILDQILTLPGEDGDGDDDDDDDRTIRPSTSQSRPPSPSPSCTIVYNFNTINHSVVSLNSEVTGVAINAAVTNEGTVSQPIPTDTNQHM